MLIQSPHRGTILVVPRGPRPSTVQYSTVQYSTVQYSTVQYSTVQYSTVQCNTVQHTGTRHAQPDVILLCKYFQIAAKIKN